MRLIIEDILPREYRRLKYIESTGTQYIDTGIKMNNAFIAAYQMEYDNNNTGTIAAASNGTETVDFGTYTNGTMTMRYLDAEWSPSINITPEQFHTIVVYYWSNMQFMVYNEEASYGFNHTEGIPSLDLNLYLFRSNSSTPNAFTGKLYYFGLYTSDGTLLRNFIPAIRKSDNAVGLFDTATKTFYENAGTGTFEYAELDEKYEQLNNPNYIQVEYLESTGTQYIDTGYTSTDLYQNSTYEIVCETLGTSNRIVGCGGLNDNNKNINLSFGASGYILALYGDKWTGDKFKYDLNTKYKIRYEMSTSQQNFYINDDLIDTTTYSWTSGSYPFRIFRTNASTYTKETKVYSFKLWINDSLVRNFIPAIRKRDNKPGMYDTVTGNFYENAGTGEFKYGSTKDSLPSAYERLEYIESTGTQYIDTGYIPNQDTRVITEHYYTKIPNTKGFVYGAGESASSKAFELYTWNLPWNSPYNTANMSINPPSESYYTSGKIIVDKNKNNIKVTYADGTSQSNSTSYAEFTAPYTMYLFAIHRPGSTLFNSDCLRLCKCTVFENDIMLHDFIPCYKKVNGEAGMYDAITGKFFGNAGTDEFIKGYKCDNKTTITRFITETGTLTAGSYRRVDYLQSSGTQWIDTEFKPNQDTKVEIIGKYLGSYPATLGACRWSQAPSYDTFGQYAENNKVYSYWGRYGSGQFYGVSMTDFNYNKGFFKYTQDKNVLKYEGIDFTGSATYTYDVIDFSAGANYALFYFYITSSTFATKGCVIKSCKIWDDGTLIRDFVPVLDSNDEPGMYDRVHGVLFKNKGTGNFTYGNIIEGTRNRLIY